MMLQPMVKSCHNAREALQQQARDQNGDSFRDPKEGVLHQGSPWIGGGRNGDERGRIPPILVKIGERIPGALRLIP
jgi:hypothetical protein